MGVEDEAMRLAGDDQRHDARANQMGVGFDFFAIDTNAPLPGWVGRIDFDLAYLAVDFEVERHGRRGVQSVPPMPSRRAAVFQALADDGSAAAEPLLAFFVASKMATAAMAGALDAGLT